MAKRKSPKQRKKEREQEKQRGQQVYIIGAVIGVVVLIAIIFALTSLPTEAPIPEDISQRYSNFMSSSTDEGYALLGNPDAPVTVREYSSFSCPGCLSFHQSVFPRLLDEIERGEINFVYVPLQTGSISNPEGAAKTAICAGEQGQFWEMHDILFSWHETFGNSAFQDGRIRTGIEELGLDRSQFNSCFNSNSTNTILTSAIQEGVASTPSIQVNGATVPADIASIEEAIASNLPAGEFEPGLIGDDDVTEDEMTEEAPMDEATEEADTSDDEATEEAPMDDSDEEMTEDEATEEADTSDDE